MPQPLSSSSQAEPENKCPDCLFMKLGGILVQPEKQGMFNRKIKSTATDQIKLYLTLKFNEQEEQLPGGCLKFGIRGGKLTLRLENGKISPASPILNGSFTLSGQQGRQNQEGSDSQRCVTVTLSEGKAGVNASLDSHKTTGKIQPCQSAVRQVSDRRIQENLSWVFVGDNSILMGSLKPTLVGILHVIAKPCRVEATFCVSPHDIDITDTAGLLPHAIAQKKRVVIERAIARGLLKRKMHPYLSWQELRFDILSR